MEVATSQFLKAERASVNSYKSKFQIKGNTCTYPLPPASVIGFRIWSVVICEYHLQKSIENTLTHS